MLPCEGIKCLPGFYCSIRSQHFLSMQRSVISNSWLLPKSLMVAAVLCHKLQSTLGLLSMTVSQGVMINNPLRCLNICPVEDSSRQALNLTNCLCSLDTALVGLSCLCAWYIQEFNNQMTVFIGSKVSSLLLQRSSLSQLPSLQFCSSCSWISCSLALQSLSRLFLPCFHFSCCDCFQLLAQQCNLKFSCILMNRYGIGVRENRTPDCSVCLRTALL